MGYGLVEGGASFSRQRGRTGGDLRMVEYGALRTPAHAPLSERLPILYEGLMELINEYNPDAMAHRELFFNKNVRTALSVGPRTRRGDPRGRPRGPHGG